jgi:hypothetical protein
MNAGVAGADPDAGADGPDGRAYCDGAACPYVVLAGMLPAEGDREAAGAEVGFGVKWGLSSVAECGALHLKID